jgi:hypothetical protein
VKILADLERKDEALSLKAKFKIYLSQHKIMIPSFAGVTVANEVQVSVQTTAVLITVK